MALNAAPPRSLSFSTSYVPSAAADATEAAQAPVACAQTAGRSAGTQISVVSLVPPPVSSASLSSANEVIVQKGAAAECTVTSHSQVEESVAGENEARKNIESALCGVRPLGGVAADTSVSSAGESGVPQQSCTEATGILFRGERRTHSPPHASSAPAGSEASSASLYSAVGTADTTRTTRGWQEQQSGCEIIRRQNAPSHSRLPAAQSTLGSYAVGSLRLWTKSLSLSSTGIEADAADEGCSLTRHPHTASATTRPQDYLNSASCPKDNCAGTVVDKTVGLAKEREEQARASAVIDTSSSAILMSGSCSASSRTPSAAPSTEPSPSLCLSQPSPTMLIRSDQAELPPSLADCCFKEEISSNNGVPNTDDAGGRISDRGNEQLHVRRKDEKHAPPGTVDDGKNLQQQHEGNTREADSEQAPMMQTTTEKRVGAEQGKSPAGLFITADSAVAGSGRIGEHITDVEIAQIYAAAAAANLAGCARETNQRVRASSSGSSGGEADMNDEAMATTARLEATTQDGKPCTPEEKSTHFLTSLSATESEVLGTEPAKRQAHSIECTAGAQTHDARGDLTEPLSPEHREEDIGFQVETCREQDNSGRVKSKEDSVDSQSYVGAASFLQKLQQRWETDADSYCHSLLSQLSVPLPAREKLLQSSASYPEHSGGAEEDDVTTAVAAGAAPGTPLPFTSSRSTPGASTARSNSTGIKDVGYDGNPPAGHGQDRGVPAGSVDRPRDRGTDTQRSTAAQSILTRCREGPEQHQQQRESVLEEGVDVMAGVGSGALHDSHDGISCRKVASTAARCGSREGGSGAGPTCDTSAGADVPSADISEALLATAAAQILQQQLRQHLRQQQQQMHHEPEGRPQVVLPHERQRHARAPENCTRWGSAAALEAVLSDSNTFAGEGQRAADEESENIRRWFESCGVAGKKAETAVATVVKRAVDLQRRLATLLTVTLRQQLNQRLLVLALAILLEKHRREPIRCEEMLREQQRLLRVLETQQQQALADLPHLYGDLPEAQQLQQQLQQLQEAEWQLRTGGGRVAAAQTASGASEQRPCKRVNRAAEMGGHSALHPHCLSASCTRTTRAPTAAAAAVDGPTNLLRSSSPPTSTEAMAEGHGRRWIVSKRNIADKNRRVTNPESRLDTSLLSTPAETGRDRLFVAARPTPSTSKYKEDMTSGTVADALAACTDDMKLRSDLAEFARPWKRSKQTNKGGWEESEPPSADKKASENGGARPRMEQPLVERFLANQVELRLATLLADTENAASANSGPGKAAPVPAVSEAASAAPATARDLWRTGSTTGNMEGKEGVGAPGGPARSSALCETPSSSPRVSAGNISCCPDALLEQGDRSKSDRTAAAAERGRRDATPATQRDAAVAGVGSCSIGPRETTTEVAAAGGKGHPLLMTRLQQTPVQGSLPAESSAVALNASRSAPCAGSDTAATGSFTSVYSRGSNARHQNDPYPHNVMIQLIQPLPTGIKLELKSQRPASLANAHAVSALTGSSSAVGSLSTSGAELPAPREYALRVSLTRHETKYCSFHSLHGILPAYNEAVRLRNKFAGLPFVLPTMTLQELHQRKEQLDAGRPLPGHGPHEAFMTVQERITYYKQTGISGSYSAKAENSSGGASGTSVCHSPRSASPTSLVASAARRCSQIAAPRAPGAATAGSSSANKSRNSRGSLSSGSVEVAAVAVAEAEGEDGAGAGLRRLSGDEVQQDQSGVCISRGGCGGGVKRGRTPLMVENRQQDDRGTWQSTTSHALPGQHEQKESTRVESTSKSAQISKFAFRDSKGPSSACCGPPEEGSEPGTAQDGKMQLRSRTTSSSGGRSDGTTISSVTETGVKESKGLAECRSKAEKRRKTGSEPDDAVECFLKRAAFSQASSSAAEEGMSPSGHTNDPSNYLLSDDEASSTQLRDPGTDSDRCRAGSIEEDTSRGDRNRLLTRNGGSKRNGSGGADSAQCPWEEQSCWDSPSPTQRSPRETTAVDGQAPMGSEHPTPGDMEVLTEGLHTEGALSSLLSEALLKQQGGAAQQSLLRADAGLKSSRRGTACEEVRLTSLQAEDEKPTQAQAGFGMAAYTEEGKSSQFRELVAVAGGGNSSSMSRKTNGVEAGALSEIAGADPWQRCSSIEFKEAHSRVTVCDARFKMNSNGEPTLKAGTGKKCTQDGDWGGERNVKG